MTSRQLAKILNRIVGMIDTEESNVKLSQGPAKLLILLLGNLNDEVRQLELPLG